MCDAKDNATYGDGVDAAVAFARVDSILSERVLVDTELTPVPPTELGERARSGSRELAATSFSIRLANTEGHRSDASFLVRKMYGWRGYGADPEHSAPNCVTLIASDHGRVLATITVGFDSPVGMAVGLLYPEEVGTFRSAGARLCEFTRLAVDRSQHSKKLLAMVFHVAYIYARQLHRMTDLLVEVNPRHASFYVRMLGFQLLGPERVCPRVNAPAVLLWLPLAHAEEQIARYGGGKGEGSINRNLYSLFFSPEEESGIVQRLRTASSL